MSKNVVVVVAWSLGAWLLAACSAPVAIDPVCTIADVECPEGPPYAGAPCEGDLSCDYTVATGSGTFACEDGRWSGEIVCALEGCAPLLAESCRGPSASPPGAVEIGPESGSFHALEEGERLSVQWGAQGLAMIAYRVRITSEAVPACASVTSRVSLDGGDPTTTSRALALRCGQSLPILEILPELPCTVRDYPVHLEVTVEGAGTTSADVVIQGGGCELLPG